MKNICALNQNNSTCLPKDTLQAISNTFIKEENITNPKEIINILANEASCPGNLNLQEKELCILKKIRNDNKDNNLSEAIEKQVIKYFKPTAKGLDSNYWLNNTEIDLIQFQLQLKFEGYYYSYIHMIDLKMYNPQNKHLILNNDKIYSIVELNFVNEIRNKIKLNYNGNLKYFGIVCNTDVSSGPGVHWFSIFIDFTARPITIEYFNSSGYSLTEGKHRHERTEFAKFFYNIADELTKTNMPAKFIQVTDIEHQRDDTANCGSYSLYYIWKRLNGTPYSYFSNTKITDEDMEKFRSYLWRQKI